MANLLELHRAVQSAVASQRIGQPVFVRYLAIGMSESDGTPLPLLARLAGVVQGWLGQPLARVYVTKTASVAATLQFAGGATALVSHGHGTESRIDVTLLGNHGALYFGPLVNIDRPTLSALPAHEAIEAVLGKSARSGQPATVSAEDQP
jgi:hypothetical protein